MFSFFKSPKKLSKPPISVGSPVSKENKSQTKNEYERCKANFLEEIKIKINNFFALKEICKNDCMNQLTDVETKSQLERMYETAANSDFLSMCGRINNDNCICVYALKLQRTIQELFIMYKTDPEQQDKTDVLEEETKFYAMTNTKISTRGGKKRFTKQKKHKKLRKTSKVNI